MSAGAAILGIFNQASIDKIIGFTKSLQSIRAFSRL